MGPKALEIASEIYAVEQNNKNRFENIFKIDDRFNGPPTAEPELGTALRFFEVPMDPKTLRMASEIYAVSCARDRK